MQTASGGGRERAPRSLKERLALLECGVRPVAAARVRAGARHKTARTPAQRKWTVLGTSFWIGLGCGSALGSAMLLLAFVTHPDEMQTRLREVQAAADAMARPSPPAPRQVRTYPRAPAGAPTQAAFAMSIHRGDGGAAYVGLRVHGIDSPDSVQVLLRDVPATAELSRGQRRDPGTWALRVAELENLQLTLGDGTPDAFDMTIEVASTGGTRMAKAVAHVRVSDPRGVAQMSAPPARALAAGVDGLRQSAMPVACGVGGHRVEGLPARQSSNGPSARRSRPWREPSRRRSNFPRRGRRCPVASAASADPWASRGRRRSLRRPGRCGGSCRRRPGRPSPTGPAATDLWRAGRPRREIAEIARKGVLGDAAIKGLVRATSRDPPHPCCRSALCPLDWNYSSSNRMRQRSGKRGISRGAALEGEAAASKLSRGRRWVVRAAAGGTASRAAVWADLSGGCISPRRRLKLRTRARGGPQLRARRVAPASCRGARA